MTNNNNQYSFISWTIFIDCISSSNGVPCHKYVPTNVSLDFCRISVLFLWDHQLYWQNNGCPYYYASYCNYFNCKPRGKKKWNWYKGGFIQKCIANKDYLFITFVFQGLPKTAYYKAIDYWFFFTLTTMIVTMLCHTITAYTIRRAQAKSLSVLEDTSFFRNKIRPVHSISGSGPETR